MGIVLLSTNLNSAVQVEQISACFNEHHQIIRWSVDTEDRDKVMRIEALDGFNENDAIALIRAKGFVGRDLDW